jgi:hypothetical protein
MGRYTTADKTAMQVANSDEVAVGNVLTVVYNMWDMPIIGYSEECISENDL